MARRLAILAGGGSLPRDLADAALAQGREVFIVAFEGQTDPAWLSPYAHAWARLGAAAGVINLLHSEQIDDVCMIGPIRRPSWAALRPDFRAMQLIGRLALSGLGQGDDRVLSTVVRELEREGFKVIGAHDIVGDLLTPLGVIGAAHPDEVALKDVRRGIEVARALGKLDVGQSVVVQQGLVLAVEAIEGTDAMLKRCAELKRDGPPGVLVKLKKPQQERRADLPAAGLRTVDGVIAAGLRGIALEAGQSLLLERSSALAAANAAGLFVIGIDPERPDLGV
ncbi:MAG: LpxI family protein [Geminicoccaceae bacterium]